MGEQGMGQNSEEGVKTLCYCWGHSVLQTTEQETEIWENTCDMCFTYEHISKMKIHIELSLLLLVLKGEVIRLMQD